MSASSKTLSALRASHPDIPLYTPDGAEYEGLVKTYIVTSSRPWAIARPRTAEHVQALIRACLEHGAEFSIRTGGHNCVGQSLVHDALTIDMRDICFVDVSPDKTTAKVGGGILVSGLVEALGEYGLVTPFGSVGSVGYVGWSTLGGYGPFSTLYGLGADQIVAARLVNSQGDIVDADEDLLEGIRGAGPIFGAIVELTVQVYPLKELLSATLVFDSSDLQSAWTGLIEGLQGLVLPDPLQVQPIGMELPGVGRCLTTIVTWVSDDHEQGHQWIKKIAALGTCIMNITEAKTPAKYARDNEKLVQYGVHGRCFTLSIKQWTKEAASVLAKYNDSVPSGSMISVHALRSPKENQRSVFGAKEPHVMIEVVSTTADEAQKTATLGWGQALLRELRERDGANILDSAYISLLADEADLSKVFGRHLETLVRLKAKYDANNAFRHAAPKVVG